jgi:hypothetical protein
MRDFDRYWKHCDVDGYTDEKYYLLLELCQKWHKSKKGENEPTKTKYVVVENTHDVNETIVCITLQ